jgi:sec-independent protein translocase protein TatB
MFDLGWSEMLLIGIVALVVVGPKELPGLFRSIGQAVGKARGMAREFTRAMEAAADESGIREIDKTIRAATRPAQFAGDKLRETALGTKTTKSALPPLNPGAPVKPGGATEALAAERAQSREDTLAAAAERRIADAERRAAEAERRALEAERRAAQPRTDETA